MKQIAASKWLPKATDKNRPQLAQPWTVGQYDVATDGHMLFAVKTDRPTPVDAAAFISRQPKPVAIMSVDSARFKAAVEALHGQYMVDKKYSSIAVQMNVHGVVAWVDIARLNAIMSGMPDMGCINIALATGTNPIQVSYEGVYALLMPLNPDHDHLTANTEENRTAAAAWHDAQCAACQKDAEADEKAQAKKDNRQPMPVPTEAVTLFYQPVHGSVSRAYAPATIADFIWQPDFPAQSTVQSASDIEAALVKRTGELHVAEAEIDRLKTEIAAAKADAKKAQRDASRMPKHVAEVKGKAPVATVDTTQPSGMPTQAKPVKVYLAWGNIQVEGVAPDAAMPDGFKWAKMFARWYGPATPKNIAAITASFGEMTSNPYSKKEA